MDLILPATEDYGALYQDGLALPRGSTELTHRHIQAVLDLAHASRPPFVPADILYCSCPIVDGPMPAKLDAFLAVVGLGVDLLRRRINVLSACAAGANRSGLLSAAIVQGLLGISPEEAIARVRSARPGALDNREFVQYLTASRRSMSG